MSDPTLDVDALRRAGAYDSREAVVEDALRALLSKRPELRTELALERYTSGAVSLNRAAEIAGVSAGEFRELLVDRGISRPAGFLSEADRERRLDDL